MLCGAKTRNGSTCTQRSMPNGRCRMHGGKSPNGIAHARFKHGRYSQFIPARMLENYQAAQNDVELLALRDEIALLDSRLLDVLKRVDTGESGQVWRELKATYQMLRAAQAKDDRDAARDHARKLGELIEHGSADWLAWSEVRSLIDQRRRTVESERKRLVEMQSLISQEKAMVLIAALTDSVRRHVSDRTALAAISADLVRLTAADPRGAALAGGDSG